MQSKNLITSLLVAVGLIAVTVMACKKSADATPYKCTTCTTQPTAVAANDASSKGIYKGVFIGSSGTIMFDVLNIGTSTISAIMILDGVTVNLTSSVTWQNGQAYVAPFTGTYNGQPVSITFSVNANGSSPMVTTSNIPGHPNTSFDIVKETSAGLIECFEGTYSTTFPENGTFNILLARSLGTWKAVARQAGTTQSSSAGYGTIVNNNLLDPAHNNRVIGTLNGDNLNGSFLDANNITVTLTGKRTF